MGPAHNCTHMETHWCNTDFMREIFSWVHLIISLKIKISLLNISFLLKSFGSYVVYTVHSRQMCCLSSYEFSQPLPFFSSNGDPPREGEELELHWSVKITDQRPESTFSVPLSTPSPSLLRDQKVPSLYFAVYLCPNSNLICKNTEIRIKDYGYSKKTALLKYYNGIIEETQECIIVQRPSQSQSTLSQLREAILCQIGCFFYTFFDMNVKKCVNVCRDKIWHNSAKSCGQNV